MSKTTAHIQQGISSHISSESIDGARIFIITEDMGKRCYLTMDGGDELPTINMFKPEDMGKPVPPFITMSDDVFDAILDAMLKHAAKNNIKAKSEHELQGRIKALEGHLEDMRRIALNKYGPLK